MIFRTYMCYMSKNNIFEDSTEALLLKVVTLSSKNILNRLTSLMNDLFNDWPSFLAQWGTRIFFLDRQNSRAFSK